jgi:predicted nucleic acid-binding protein
MLVVSDTSPISNLAIIGRLDILRQRYGEVRIPDAVAKELTSLTRVEARKSFEAAMTNRWIVKWKDAPAHLSLKDRAFLGLGETAAIDLALDIKADLLLMDEKKGREVARRHGLIAGGLLGELLHAKQRGWISDVKDEILRLRTEARFFISAEIERLILKEAGE